jgi:hypothetical protein
MDKIMNEIEELLGGAKDADEVETPTLTLSKGGILTITEWVYDETAGKGEYVTKDISNDAKWLHKRDRDVSIAPGTTLNDIFTFVARDTDLWDIILTNCYVRKFIDTWIKIDQTKINFTQEYDPDGIEYLELYWGTDMFTWAGKTKISGLSRADFHGKGFVLREDKCEDNSDYVLYKGGTRIQWGLDFTDLKDLLGLPVRLDTQLKVVEEWRKGMTFEDIKTLLDVHRDFSLQEVLEGIFWEISFYGGEEEKIEKRDEVMAIKNSIDFDSYNGIEP